MDKTPKIPKSLTARNNFSEGPANEFRLCPSPIFDTKMFTETENDDSPVRIACTQEGCDNVDVVWDWNSPQAKQRPKKTKKRLILSQSPKILVKRYPSNNQIQNFERLREELQSLREAMAVPDHEESLMLSPVEEAEYKDVSNEPNGNDLLPPTQEICIEDDDDMFNDSADEQLILCTQKIEADLEVMGKNVNFSNGLKKEVKPAHFNNNIKNTCNGNLNSQSTKSFNTEVEDSFANVLGKIDVECLEVNNGIDNRVNQKGATKNITRLGITRTMSENQYKNSRQVSKVEFHRTQSFESTVEYAKEVIPRQKLDEIERKRKEALAKLESKKKQERNDSPWKCSPEEIEQKRLQALAKLEAKRQQDIIERKRQEALKRLQLNRKKNAMGVKSSLSKRL